MNRERENTGKYKAHSIPTTKPLHRASMALQWLEESIKVFEQTGFEKYSATLRNIHQEIAAQINPEIEKEKEQLLKGS